jgi:uncharacterized membrane protein YcaP (DUF421 family)
MFREAPLHAQQFFDGWSGIGRVLLTGTAAYAFLVVVLRSSGKRTLTKLNAFDLIVTVALGSTLASILTSSTLALAEGLAALALLVGLQFVVTFLAVRWPAFDAMIKSEPSVLLRDGRPIEPALKRERITEDELRSAVRKKGGRELSEAEVILLETDGSLTAILRR